MPRSQADVAASQPPAARFSILRDTRFTFFARLPRRLFLRARRTVTYDECFRQARRTARLLIIVI